jgi:hypothetical protein
MKGEWHDLVSAMDLESKLRTLLNLPIASLSDLVLAALEPATFQGGSRAAWVVPPLKVQGEGARMRDPGDVRARCTRVALRKVERGEELAQAAVYAKRILWPGSKYDNLVDCVAGFSVQRFGGKTVLLTAANWIGCIAYIVFTVLTLRGRGTVTFPPAAGAVYAAARPSLNETHTTTRGVIGAGLSGDGGQFPIGVSYEARCSARGLPVVFVESAPRETVSATCALLERVIGMSDTLAGHVGSLHRKGAFIALTRRELCAEGAATSLGSYGIGRVNGAHQCNHGGAARAVDFATPVVVALVRYAQAGVEDQALVSGNPVVVHELLHMLNLEIYYEPARNLVKEKTLEKLSPLLARPDIAWPDIPFTFLLDLAYKKALDATSLPDNVALVYAMSSSEEFLAGLVPSLLFEAEDTEIVYATDVFARPKTIRELWTGDFGLARVALSRNDVVRIIGIEPAFKLVIADLFNLDHDTLKPSAPLLFPMRREMN